MMKYISEEWEASDGQVCFNIYQNRDGIRKIFSLYASERKILIYLRRFSQVVPCSFVIVVAFCFK